jgi:hypothetical protein
MKDVGRLDRVDPGQRQLLDQAVLQGLEHPLRATARLRRIGGDMLDAQPLERPPDLRRLLAVDRAGLGGEKVMGAPVRIEAERQAALAKDFA